MIVRIWHGYTKPENADAYAELLRTKVLPGIHRVSGYKGAYLLRRKRAVEVEFVTLTLWESLDAVTEFAGAESSHAVVPEEARRLLERFDERSEHYDAEWVA
jgi:heme-degrading monooxygenase HmoA